MPGVGAITASDIDLNESCIALHPGNGAWIERIFRPSRVLDQVFTSYQEMSVNFLIGVWEVSQAPPQNPALRAIR